MDATTVRQKLESALDAFCAEHEFLLLNDLNERTIAHHLANAIAEEFEDWSVDCEYNRDGLETPKKLALDEHEPTRAGETNAVTVFPDIIVHHRGDRGAANNLVVVEIKKSSNRDDGRRDERKLDAFKRQLEYQSAYFLRLTVDKCEGRRWTLTSR